jgi:hypothetical protein
MTRRGQGCLKCLVVNDPVGPADLLSDPGRPLVNATRDFRVERSPLKGVPRSPTGLRDAEQKQGGEETQVDANSLVECPERSA